MTGVAFIGCGYVADFYVQTLKNHPSLRLQGVFDRDLERARRFSVHYQVKLYEEFSAVLIDPLVQIVVNLTNPCSHFEVSRAALEAGKHVYSEKPLAMSFEDAQALVRLADFHQLQIACAPCSLLGESAQTLWKAIRENRIGQVRLIYAELDDGPIHQTDYHDWKSESGSPWPYKNEFEVGCTVEHAAYYLSWLCAIFGPVEKVTSFASVCVPDKGVQLECLTPDFSVACLEFCSGVVARLTCSIVAPHDHSLRVIGDQGVLAVKECWNYASPVTLVPLFPPRPPKRRRFSWGRAAPQPSPDLPLVRPARFDYQGHYAMDFSRGVSELASAITEGRPSKLGGRFALHINEVVLAIQGNCGVTHISSRFDEVRPERWSEPCLT